ncbi:DUF2188 domain-containing protein [Luteibacter aegosomatis]|uniref:DUF2188 domain-containing protein n=1 Tax=Luteibacter aegosomatis TaxID=2911537 RepID=UPI001FF947FC|nr:DUF2188 domain-containing protein [Luteibacter aegosomatis]UPG86238.1 DUF2188 domain-containing protein [Luteibacter aegosomatis]
MASSSAQLFIPYSESTQGPWIVRRASLPLGRYASQAEAIAAAEQMAPGLSDHLGRPVEIHVQHADGTWEEHTFVVAGLVAGVPPAGMNHRHA